MQRGIMAPLSLAHFFAILTQEDEKQMRTEKNMHGLPATDPRLATFAASVYFSSVRGRLARQEGGPRGRSTRILCLGPGHNRVSERRIFTSRIDPLSSS